MSLVLDSLEIKNFRAFKHLRIEKLRRVNLIDGKNNAGKSSVLEASWLYILRGEPAAIEYFGTEMKCFHRGIVMFAEALLMLRGAGRPLRAFNKKQSAQPRCAGSRVFNKLAAPPF